MHFSQAVLALLLGSVSSGFALPQDAGRTLDARGCASRGPARAGMYGCVSTDVYTGGSDPVLDRLVNKREAVPAVAKTKASSAPKQTTAAAAKTSAAKTSKATSAAAATSKGSAIASGAASKTSSTSSPSSTSKSGSATFAGDKAPQLFNAIFAALKPDTSKLMFWSGVNADEANASAEKNGYITLEMLMRDAKNVPAITKDKALSELLAQMQTPDDDFYTMFKAQYKSKSDALDAKYAAWGKISGLYGAKHTGNVAILQTFEGGPLEGAVFVTQELPNLKAKGAKIKLLPPIAASNFQKGQTTGPARKKADISSMLVTRSAVMWKA